MILGEEINRRPFGHGIPDFTTSFCINMGNRIDICVESPPRIYNKPSFIMFYEFINLKRSINFRNTDENRNN